MRRTWSSAATSSLNQRHFFYVLLAVLNVLNWSVNAMVADARRPPNYHHDQMPDTTFTCAGKVVGGYYADPDADCQMFHVCVQVDENDVRDFKFMCPTDTVFDQENFICANWFEIDCRSSTLFYDKNLQLFQPERHHNKGSSATSTTEEPSDQQKRQQEQQLKQLMVLEEQQQAQVLKQQQVLELHERRQQEHQRTQLKIIQDQQKQLEQQQGRKIPPAGGRPVITTTTTTTSSPTDFEKGEESIIYDYYYYDEYEESSEQGHFYVNDEFDPNAPGRIIDPTNARPPLLPILPPAKTILDSKTKQ